MASIIKKNMEPKCEIYNFANYELSDAEADMMMDEMCKSPKDTICRLTEFLRNFDLPIADMDWIVNSVRNALADPDEFWSELDYLDEDSLSIVCRCFSMSYRRRIAYIFAWRNAVSADRELKEAEENLKKVKQKWEDAKINFEKNCMRCDTPDVSKSRNSQKTA